MNLFAPLVLPNGSVIPNRIAKSAMEENMADLQLAPSARLLRLYESWAKGGAGLIITGNVMVDARAMTGPAGVVLEDSSQLPTFERWARLARANGAQAWLQINHPGRQMQANLGQETWAPSAVPLELGKMSKRFRTPVAMSEPMIEEVIQRFANTALLAERAGFSGVEVHAAHGYLLNQFLSPRTNRRDDQWGGSLVNRSRILLEIIRRIRASVSPSFSVAVKLNSADFQRGGFTTQDAKDVVSILNTQRVDLVELSGGSYEAPAMQGVTRDERTLAREAYFLEFARDIRDIAKMPLMVTGGIRRREVAQRVIDDGVDMVGMATALALEPDLPNKWLSGSNIAPELRPITWNSKPLASLANMAVVRRQMRRIAAGKSANASASAVASLALQQASMAYRTRTYRSFMAARSMNTPR